MALRTYTRAVSSVYRDNTTENAENYGLEELLEQAKQPVLARNRRLFEYLQSLLATLNFGDTKGNVAQGCLEVSSLWNTVN